MKSNPLTLLALCCVAFAGLSLRAEDPSASRLWTDAKGRQLEATFVVIDGEFITLKKPDGADVRFPLATLSPADQKFAKEAKPMVGAFVPTNASAAVAAVKIDSLVAKRLAEVNLKRRSTDQRAIEMNPLSTDEQFARRVYLDIAGRIPSYEEVSEFLASTSGTKRGELIDKLLDSDGYTSNLYNYFADMLRIVDKVDKKQKLLQGLPYMKWLKDSIASNRTYDVMVKEMMTANGKLWNNGAAGYLLRDAGMPLDNLATTLTVFLGTDVACAQCHDHPFADWSQMQFYQMASFFGATATKLSPSDYPKGRDPSKALMAEMTELMKASGTDSRKMKKSVGEVLKVNEVYVHDLDSNRIKLPHDYKYKDGKPFDPVKPKFIVWGKDDAKLPAYKQDIKSKENLREAFASWMTHPTNPRFAMTIANRMWERAMGVGFTQSVGSIDDVDTCSNPALIRHLASEMVRLKFNLKEFNRLIYNTKTYQREATATEVPMGDAYYFPGPMLRRMTAEQAWDSYMTLVLGKSIDSVKNTQAEPYGRAIDLDLTKTTVATLAQKFTAFHNLGNLAKEKVGGGLADAGKKKKGKDMDADAEEDEEEDDQMSDAKILQYGGMKLMRASELEQPSPAGHFLRDFGQSDRTITDGSAKDGSVPQVLTMMNGRAQQMMTEKDSLMFRTVAKAKTTEAKMETIYLSILNRRPDDREKTLIMKDFAANADRSYANVIWALINSREFTFIQ